MMKLFLLVPPLLVAILLPGGQCGPGSYITIINNTPDNFKRVENNSFQMDDWDFPSQIASYSRKKIYYEYCAWFFNDQTKNVGYVKYEIVGLNRFFSIKAVHDYPDSPMHARRGNWPNIWVEFFDLPGLGYQKFDMVWVINANVDLDLNYHQNNDTFSSKALWVSRNVPREKPEWRKKLEEIHKG